RQLAGQPCDLVQPHGQLPRLLRSKRTPLEVSMRSALQVWAGRLAVAVLSACSGSAAFSGSGSGSSPSSGAATGRSSAPAPGAANVGSRLDAASDVGTAGATSAKHDAANTDGDIRASATTDAGSSPPPPPPGGEPLEGFGSSTTGGAGGTQIDVNGSTFDAVKQAFDAANKVSGPASIVFHP